MKKIGFSLAEIRAHMERYDLDSSLALFRRQLDVIDQKIQELRMIRSRVQSRCSQMESALDRCRRDQDIQLEQAGEQNLFCCPVEPPYSLREISIATKALLFRGFPAKAAGVLPVRGDGAPGADSGGAVYRGFRGVPAGGGPPCQTPGVRRLAPGLRACIYHVGGLPPPLAGPTGGCWTVVPGAGAADCVGFL